MAETAPRRMLPEDLEFDPTYARQRMFASYLMGEAVNALIGARRVGDDGKEPRKVGNAIRDHAIALGIITFDDHHHAPMCPANHYHMMRAPTGPCTCGAARAASSAKSVKSTAKPLLHVADNSGTDDYIPRPFRNHEAEAP